VFAPNGRRVVTASSDETARIWDTGATTPIRIFSVGLSPDVYGPLTGITPDGRLVASVRGSDDLRIWDTKTGHLRARARAGTGTSYSSALALSADGRRVAAPVAHAAAAAVWDATTGAHLA